MKNSNKKLLDTLSYIALIIIAVLIVITSPLLKLTGIIVPVLKTIEKLLILIVVGFYAYNFASIAKRKWVKIVYWISIAVFVVGIVFLWI